MDNRGASRRAVDLVDLGGIADRERRALRDGDRTARRDTLPGKLRLRGLDRQRVVVGADGDGATVERVEGTGLDFVLGVCGGGAEQQQADAGAGADMAEQTRIHDGESALGFNDR